MKTLYWAYGLNTNVRAMADRCPNAVPIGIMDLADHKLVFRCVADVVDSSGDSVTGALWWITPECERALDQLEGYPHMYTKRYGTVALNGVVQEFMYYQMVDTSYMSPPYFPYEANIREGYANFGISPNQIDKAIIESLTTGESQHDNSRQSDSIR